MSSTTINATNVQAIVTDSLSRTHGIVMFDTNLLDTNSTTIQRLYSGTVVRIAGRHPAGGINLMTPYGEDLSINRNDHYNTMTPRIGEATILHATAVTAENISAADIGRIMYITNRSRYVRLDNYILSDRTLHFQATPAPYVLSSETGRYEWNVPNGDEPAAEPMTFTVDLTEVQTASPELLRLNTVPTRSLPSSKSVPGQVSPAVATSEAHRQDIERIGEMLNKEANDRNWCSEFDDGIAAINAGLTIPLPARSRHRDVTIAVSQDFTVAVTFGDAHTEIEVGATITLVANDIEMPADVDDDIAWHDLDLDLDDHFYISDISWDDVFTGEFPSYYSYNTVADEVKSQIDEDLIVVRSVS